jgi:hypothetical protein
MELSSATPDVARSNPVTDSDGSRAVQFGVKGYGEVSINTYLPTPQGYAEMALDFSYTVW